MQANEKTTHLFTSIVWLRIPDVEWLCSTHHSAMVVRLKKNSTTSSTTPSQVYLSSVLSVKAWHGYNN